MQYCLTFIFFSLLSVPGLVRAVCPDLSPYYQQDAIAPDELQQQLALLMPECLNSAEYFALYGGVQLDAGMVEDATESLERALLIEPDNGAAQIDYATALFQQGQIFTALEINDRLLERPDTPPALLTVLQQRQQTWRAYTRQRTYQLDVLAGYDSNLNGAPDPGQITLTLSGEPVFLELNPEFRPVSGPYLNLRLGTRYRQLAPEHQHNWSTELRGRLSEDTESDLLQLDNRYSFIRPGAGRSWQLDGGISNLFFGGSALYTATEGRFRYQSGANQVCRPFYGAAVQHQLFHNQSHLNAVESKATAGVTCPKYTSRGRQLYAIEFSLLNNTAVKSRRPGGDRDGWQVNANWQYVLPQSMIRAQINHTKLNDRRGYSPLLANGADRWLERSYLLVQYSKPLPVLGEQTSFMANFFHQRQRSNIELFRSVDSTFEVGLSISF